MSILFITSQVLLRMCRLTITDILSINISHWEASLSIVTVLRISLILIMIGFDLEIMSYSVFIQISNTFLGIILFLYIVSVCSITKLVYDANIAIRLDKKKLPDKFVGWHGKEAWSKNPVRTGAVEMIRNRKERSSVTGSEEEIIYA